MISSPQGSTTGKDQLLKSALKIFENRGRKVDEDRIMAENDKEIAGLKVVIAHSNLPIFGH